MYQETEKTKLTLAFECLRATLVALAVSFVGAFLFAIALRLTDASDKLILPVNETIKVVAIFLGVFLCVRGDKGLLKGGLTGLFTTMLSYLAFSALGGDFSLSYLAVLELLFGIVVGALSGVFAVNVKRN